MDLAGEVDSIMFNSAISGIRKTTHRLMGSKNMENKAMHHVAKSAKRELNAMWSMESVTFLKYPSMLYPNKTIQHTAQIGLILH